MRWTVYNCGSEGVSAICFGGGVFVIMGIIAIIVLIIGVILIRVHNRKEFEEASSMLMKKD